MEWIRKFPKIELHCHLDGSLPLETLRNLTGKPDLPAETLTAPRDCKSLSEYLTKFDLPLSVMQTGEDLKRTAEDFLCSLARDGIKYVEVRFAPMLHTEQGLSCGEVLETVIDGLEAGSQKTGIDARVIVCAMRHHSCETNLSMLKSAMEFYGSGVVALDLAGDESGFPNEGFRELFQKARAYQIPFTIHSGECGSLINVQTAVECGARRIGHGIALAKSPELMKEFAKRGIGIELCPTSNFQTKAVTERSAYPLKKFLDAGLKVSINTDNRTVSGTDLTTELVWALEFLGSNQIELLQKNAIETAFAEDNIKQKLWEEISHA